MINSNPLNTTGWLALAGVGTLVIYVLVHVVPAAFPASLLYLAPVVLVTYAARTTAGVAWAGVCAGAYLSGSVALHGEGTPWTALAWDAGIAFVSYSAVAILLGRLRHHEAQLAHAADEDPLTAVANRRAFEAALHQRLRFRWTGSGRFAIAYFDLDDFKQVNDREGHAAGDAVLVAVGRALRAHTRAGDIVARLGGDEFAVLFDTGNVAGALGAVERVRASLRSGQETPRRIEASVGLVSFRSLPASVADALACADELMYESKRGAKGGLLCAEYRGGHEDAPLVVIQSSVQAEWSRLHREPARVDTRDFTGHAA